MMALVAMATKSTSSVLEIKGKEREMWRLHSMTFSLLSLAMSWMLNGSSGGVRGREGGRGREGEGERI